MRKEWTWEGDDGETVVRTCAWSPPGCHPTGCGLLLHVKDGQLVKVEGDPEHPITRGALCPRCLALKDYVYHPDRIIYPMKRDRADRGKDKWERCTWDEAYDLIETNAKYIKKTYGAETILVFGGTGRAACIYYPMMAVDVFGTPNPVYAQSGFACYYPRVVESSYMTGAGYPEIDYACRYPDRYDHPGWQYPRYILVWGKEPLKSNADGLWGHAVTDLMQLGSKLIVVDPRITWLATRAEIVLQLRPGTDGAVAMAMVKTVIEEELYDKEFVDNWVYGFDEFAARVCEMSAEQAAEISGVDAELIREAARKFASNWPSALCWGLAIDQIPNGAQVAQSLIGLMTITNNFDVPGGNSVDGIGTNKEQKGRYDAKVNEYMPAELWEKRIGAKRYPAICDTNNRAHPDVMLDTLESGEPYKMHMAFFHSSNVADGAISAAPQRWLEALRDIDFGVCSDTFMNPTAMALADVFLPVATFAEADGFVYPHYGLNSAFFGCINKAITVGETKSDIQIMMDLGKRMNPDYWNQFEDDKDWIAKTRIPGGLSWEEFQANGCTQLETEYKKYEKGHMRPDGQIGFNTQTGRIELWCSAYARYGEDPLPYYQEPPYSPLSTPEVYAEYPLVLTTGARTFVSFHSEHRQIRALRKIHPDPILEVHPETAEKYGITEGMWVWIETQWGKATEKAHITTTIRPDTVHAEHGWWFPERDAEEPELFGHRESNINSVMPSHVVGKLGMGDTFKCQLCKIYPNTEKAVGSSSLDGR